ncbi:peptide-methionine (S)-S-oxide reductase [Alteromonadaceae bacterium Bs31]|nr:peptide-methionine (S)-S-oxide reductase [Alteromonadaceae bacterium Bs31]
MDLFERINQRMANKIKVPEPEACLPGRESPIATAELHAVLGEELKPPFPENSESIIFGLGCFWGAERKFWQLDGVHVTAVGYSGGSTPNPTYKEVCSGQTGHNEVVLVVYHPEVCSIDKLLTCFWQSHDPSQGMRQGNDIGTQYRSGIYFTTQAQADAAEASKQAYQKKIAAAGFSEITTEIKQAGPFYYAEAYHQQYLEKNPNGYCGLGGTGVSC